MAQARGSATGTDFEVWPDCWDAWQAFEAMATQWNVVADMGRGRLLYIGLNYAAWPVVLEAIDIAPADRRQIFQDLRLMEAAARSVLNKARN